MAQMRKNMENTAVVFHNGGLAYYNVSKRDEQSYVARLFSYTGEERNAPPKVVSFEKLDRHCVGNIEDQSLIEEIYYSVKNKFSSSSNSMHRGNPSAPFSRI
jgi:hypothetical protein